VQNLARAGVVSVGGAPKLPWDINILAGDLIASSFVPDDLKRELVETGSPGFFRKPPLDWKELQSDFNDYYRDLYQDMDDTEYIGALHFYILRDVLTYLLSHELGHADLGTFSSHNSQLSYKAGRLQVESSADIRAMEIIAQLADTDLRSLILSLAFFIAYQDSIGESDQDHPLPADRVKLMFASAQSLTPSLILDIDAGYSFFADQDQTYTPLAHDKEMYGLPYHQISAFPGVDHSVRFRVQYDLSSYTLSKKSPSEVVLDVSIQLYQVLDPDRTPIVVHYRGHVLGQDPLRNQEVAFGPNGTFRGVRPYEAIHVLRLPPDVWTLCPNCGIRIKQLSFLRPQSNVTPSWSTNHRSVQAMLGDLETLLDKGQQPYALLFLARGLYDEHRLDDAGYVYSRIAKDYANLLSPADWIKYAATYSQDRALERAKLLDLAIQRYPTTSILAMAKGLSAEQGGDVLNAFDGYYREKIVSTGSIYEVQSGERIFKLLHEESTPESPKAILRKGFSSYVSATKDCNNPNEPPDTSKRLHCAMLFEKASSAFTSIGKISPNFSFLNMAAEATLYHHLYAGLPLHAPEQMLTSLIQKGFAFPVVYKKLVLIAECRKDYKAAQAWFIAAIRNNLGSFHPTLLDMLRLLKHEGALWCQSN
jgi:tetratricopeptide (TPR) repeat protein